MKSEYVSVCKQIIAKNNKEGWRDPQPAIRVSSTPSGTACKRAHRLAIKDANGTVVAEILSSSDGKPVLRCGAKVAIVTVYETEVLA